MNQALKLLRCIAGATAVALWACTLSAAEPLRHGLPDYMTYPWVVRDASGGLNGGLLREIGEAIAVELGTTAHHVPLSRRRMESAVQSAEVDLVCYWSPKWAEQPQTMDWSIGSLPQIERLVTLRGGMVARLTVDALDGKRVAAQLGYRYPELDAWFESGRVKRIDETRVALMFKSLEVGASDVMVTSEDEIEGYFHAEPQARERFDVSAYTVSKVITQCAVSKQSRYPLAAIDKALGNIIRRGDLARMAARYRLSSR